MKKLLRRTAIALALGAAVFAGACVEEDAASTNQNVHEIFGGIMGQESLAPGEFCISRDKGGEWHFELIGDRGDIILASEGYVERPSAENGILSVEENGVDVAQYEVIEADGEWTFVLRAKNNQVIGDGQRFKTQADAEAAVARTRDLVAAILQHKAAVTSGARFDLWRGEDREWYFVLRDHEGRVLLESEGYEGRTGAVNGMDSVRTNGRDIGRYQLLEDGAFILKAANGQEIARSASTFGSAAEAEAAIQTTANLLDSERVGNPW